jgi:hypothetical protein
MSNAKRRATIPMYSNSELVAGFSDQGFAPFDSDEHAQLKVDEFEWQSSGERQALNLGVAENDHVEDWSKRRPIQPAAIAINYGLHQENTVFALPQSKQKQLQAASNNFSAWHWLTMLGVALFVISLGLPILFLLR